MYPSLALFLENFYCNPARKNAPLGNYGGVAIQRRKACTFPLLALASHPKGWQNSYFYCVDTSPAEDPARFPAYRDGPLERNEYMNSYGPDNERAQLPAIMSRAKALLAHGLSGVDLVRCWIQWQIQPVAMRPKMICQYSGSPDDSLRFSRTELSEAEVLKNVKRLVGETRQACTTIGLAPFYTKNPAPTVSSFTLLYFHKLS